MKRFLFLFTFLALPLSAKEVTWIPLQAHASYRDLSVFCSSGGFPKTFYLAAELQENTVRAGSLRTSKDPVMAFVRPLSSKEMTNMVVVKEAGGFWVQKMQLDAATLAWILAQGIPSLSETCYPSEPIISLGASSSSFEFDLSGTSMVPATALSNMVKIFGSLKDQTSFNAELRFAIQPR